MRSFLIHQTEELKKSAKYYKKLHKTRKSRQSLLADASKWRNLRKTRKLGKLANSRGIKIQKKKSKDFFHLQTKWCCFGMFCRFFESGMWMMAKRWWNFFQNEFKKLLNFSICGSKDKISIHTNSDLISFIRQIPNRHYCIIVLFKNQYQEWQNVFSVSPSKKNSNSSVSKSMHQMSVVLIWSLWLAG